MIKRNILDKLLNWKNDDCKKPLILKWARQVWKSFIVKEFWKKYYKNYFEINFQNNKEISKIFNWNLKADELIKKIEFYLWNRINIKTDLLFFDEIQDCPKAINSLKFFHEELPELNIISAWSYLWLIKNNESFPVWKVDFLSMFPMNFEEFLQAVKPELYEIYQKIDLKKMKTVDDFYHQEFLKHLNLFFAIWGMPEIVNFFLKNKSKKSEFEIFKKIREKQLNLIEAYKSDFTKYSKLVNSSNILAVYESIPQQLAKNYDEEVDKFKFSNVIPNQKWFDRIIWPLTWLSKSRLVIKNYIISNIDHPLKWFIQNNKFKLFFHDMWLLNAILRSPIEKILLEELWSYKWFIAENFIAQELFYKIDDDLLSWVKWTSEIEFIFEKNWEIIPLEVKSSKKTRRAKSLNSYVNKYNPNFAYKLTLQNYWYNQEKNITILPMYLVWKI